MALSNKEQRALSKKLSSIWSKPTPVSLGKQEPMPEGPASAEGFGETQPASAEGSSETLSAFEQEGLRADASVLPPPPEPPAPQASLNAQLEIWGTVLEKKRLVTKYEEKFEKALRGQLLGLIEDVGLTVEPFGLSLVKRVRSSEPLAMRVDAKEKRYELELPIRKIHGVAFPPNAPPVWGLGLAFLLDVYNQDYSGHDASIILHKDQLRLPYPYVVLRWRGVKNTLTQSHIYGFGGLLQALKDRAKGIDLYACQALSSHLSVHPHEGLTRHSADVGILKRMMLELSVRLAKMVSQEWTGAIKKEK